MNLPDTIQNEDKVVVMWRRGNGAKASKAGHVVGGRALISDKITLRAMMDFDPLSQTFVSKVTQV